MYGVVLLRSSFALRPHRCRSSHCRAEHFLFAHGSVPAVLVHALPPPVRCFAADNVNVAVAVVAAVVAVVVVVAVAAVAAAAVAVAVAAAAAVVAAAVAAAVVAAAVAVAAELPDPNHPLKRALATTKLKKARTWAYEQGSAKVMATETVPPGPAVVAEVDSPAAWELAARSRPLSLVHEYISANGRRKAGGKADWKVAGRRMRVERCCYSEQNWAMSA